MPTLLIVHHTTSPALREMYEAVAAGAAAPGLEEVEVISRPALAATAIDVLASDACIVGTPVNIGYMSGALKHFFDGIFYPCLNALPHYRYAAYLHGNNETAGAVRAIESIATGLGWRRERPPVLALGPIGRSEREACTELGSVMAAALL